MLNPLGDLKKKPSKCAMRSVGGEERTHLVRRCLRVPLLYALQLERARKKNTNKLESFKLSCIDMQESNSPAKRGKPNM